VLVDVGAAIPEPMVLASGGRRRLIVDRLPCSGDNDRSSRWGIRSMAKTTIVTLVDDLDGSTANETVLFTLDGVSFEIDLSRDNADAFRRTLQPFIDAGTRVTPGGQRHTRTVISTQGASRREESRAIRAWAHRYGRQLGLAEVGNRGAIPQTVRKAYEKHNGRAPRTALASPFLAPQQ
jgi:hypothetical protein